MSSLRWRFLNKEVRIKMSRRLGNFLLHVGQVDRTPLHVLLQNPGNATQMKPFVDPNLEPIDSPPFDNPAELCI